jgi:hypothetical protein
MILASARIGSVATAGIESVPRNPVPQGLPADRAMINDGGC